MGFNEEFWSLYYKDKKKKKEEEDNSFTVETSSKESEIDGFDEDEFWSLYYGDKKAKQNNDIAPVRSDKEASEKRTWFQKGAFSDGYDFGDISRTILGTAQDVRENLYTGALGIVEKTIDAGAGILGTVGKVFGADGFADKMQGFAEKDLIDEQSIAKKATYNTQSGISHMLIGKEEEDNSILGDKSDSLVQSGGQLAAQIGLQRLGVPWWVTSGVSGFGGEFESASKEGASIYEAAGSGLISAGAEILTEKLTGGSGLGEKGLINVERFTKGVANKTVKRLLDYGIDVVGEGAEEVVSSIFSRLGSKLYKEESLKELLLSEEAFDEYLEGFIGGAVLGGGMNVGKVSSSAKNKTDYRTGLTSNEEAVVNKEVEKRIAEEEKAKGEKLTNKEKAEIQDRVLKDLDKGGISIDTIEEALGGDSYKSYQDTVKKEDSVIEEEKTLRDEFNTLNRMKKGDMTGEQTDRLEELRTKLSDLSTQIENTKKTSERDFLQKKYKNEVEEIAKGSRLEESYNERARRGEKFTADLSKYDKKQQAVIQKAIDSGILNNTNRTHEFVDLVSKIAADKGVSFDFTNNEKLKSSGFAVDGMTVNGYVTKDGVTVNIQSSKSLNSVVGHEIAHVLEGTELYTELQKAITEYAKSKGDYQGRYDTLSKLYENIEGADVNAELTADLVGDYLFTDADFVNNLSVNHRNVFQKIYDEIKYLYKVATAGTKEARELEKVKRAFEEAYRAQGEALGDTDVRHSLSIKHTDGTVEELADARSLTNEQAVDYLKQAKKGQIQGHSYVPVRKDTPQVIIDSLSQVGEEIQNRSLVMQVVKAQQSMKAKNSGNRSGKYGNNVRGHALTAEQIVEIVNKLDDPSAIIYQTNRQDKEGNALPNNVAVFVEYDNNGAESVAVIEFDSSIDSDYIGTEFGDTEYHTVVTVFEPDIERDGMPFDYAEELLSNPDNILLNIERRQSTGSATQEKHPNTSSKLPSSEGSISQKENVVNRKFSLSSDSEGRELSEAVKKRFEKSKVVDESGNLKVVYHGTASGEFTIFDKSKGSVEGDFGSGFYFTDNEADVSEHYEGGGPDFDNKVARRAELIEAADDVSYDEAKEIARAELFKGAHKFEVYLNIENPAIVGETRLFESDSYLEEYNEEDYDDYDDYIADVEQLVADDVEKIIWEVERNTGAYSTDGLADIFYNAYYEGGIGIEELKSQINDLYLEDDNGNFIGNEVARQVIESLGYDGIIDPTVSGKWNMDIEEGTTHYIVFKPNQIKAVTNQNPTDNPDINRSLSGEGEAQKKYGNYNVYGKDIAYEGAAEDVAPIRDDVASAENDVLSDDYAPMTEEDAAMIENEALDSITDADAPPEVDTPYDVQRDTGTIEDKPLKNISDKASEYLGLNRNERVTFENIVQNYSQNENLDRDYLFSQIRDNFSVREEIVPNEDVRQMKKDIKSMNLFVSDEVKSDFGKSKEDGYTKFLRSNFGKLRIVKDAANGIEVDSAYEELSSLYPSYFPEDIINPADRLRTIADVASMSSEDVFPIEVSEAEIQEVADMVYIGVSEYMNEARLSAAEASVAPHSDTDAPLIESDIEAEENKVLSVREMYDQKKQNYRDSLAALEAGKEKSLASFNEAIGKKLDEYNALRNKNTKRANTLLQQIENLRLRRDNVQGDYTNRIAKQQVRLENFESKDFKEFEQKILVMRRKDIHKQKIDEIKAQYEANGYDFDEVLNNGKDLWTIKTVENTPQRVMDKAFGWEEGHILSDMTVNKVAEHTTESIKWLNTITDRKNGLIAQLVKDYGIKPGSNASKAAQMYAEGFWVDKNNNIWNYGDTELEKDFPNSNVRENIKKLAKDQRIRQFYDETLDKINESRRRNAYPEIPKLENYFLHFREMEDFFSRNGLPFNPNDIKSKNLPTDVLGNTIDRRPGQPFFASGMHREGKRTSFDILRGLEKYANSALPQIYYIDDIQTLRALRNYVTESYGQAKGLENLDDLSEAEQDRKVKEVYNGHLATFASFLNEEANILAGKTALVDRGFSEGTFGRGVMSFMNTLNRQVGSNQVGYNVSSALTNLIAPVQAFAKTNKADFIKGFAQTVSNRIKSINGKSDGFTDESPVVIRRKGAERYYRNFWQKMSDPGYALAGAVDNFSTELIARAKYNELTRKGMDSETAHVETDKWVSRLMGDRSLGQQPLIYNSKVLGILTKYQLEVRNQLDSQFYDTIQEAKASTEDIENGLQRNAKKAAKITATFAELAIGQHIFGKVFESIAGYNPAFDIINVIIKAFGFDDDEESEDTILDNFGQALYELSGDMPYSSLFLDGGRIPMASAIPDVGQILNGEDDYGRKIGFEASFIENLAEVAPYYLMPGGYGQLKKTTQGLGMFDEEHPISGSYTDSGKLRFPVEDTFLNRVQAGIFGQYASENARDYFDNERKALDEKQIQEFIDSGISIQDYWNYREGLSGLKTLNEKADYINGLDLPIEVKNLLINNLSGRKDPIDLSGMEGYTDFNEYDFAQKNPEKYEWLKNNGITVEQYEGFDKETKEEYDFAYKSPEKYVVAKSVGGYSSYKTYTSDLYDIKADKDEDGKTISGSRKEKVIDYINNLDADYGEKIILFKSEYPADDTYNYEIIDYLNSRDDISYEEMNTILKELGFTIQPDGVTITWD